MEWLIGIAGGLMLGGLIFGGMLGNIWIVAIAAAAGFMVAKAGSCYRKAQAEAAAHERLSQYPLYKY
jgi:hypothetical protein